jgi:hypothetical protein
MPNDDIYYIHGNIRFHGLPSEMPSIQTWHWTGQNIIPKTKGIQKMQKPKRLSLAEENDIMRDATNESNIQDLIKMLPYFYLKDASYDIVKEALENDFENIEGHDELTRKLHLNKQLRAFYEIPSDANNDKSYDLYYDFLMGFYYADGNEKMAACKVIQEACLNDYDVYMAGRFTYKKQEQKLFKWLLKNKVMTKDQVEAVTHARNNKQTQLLLVTRNPVDYMFISTNQNYGSCMNFDSTCEGCFWLSYPAMFVEKDRFLVAIIPDTRLKTYRMKDKYEYKHFKYSKRSWYLWMKDNDRSDPNSGTEFFHDVSWYPSDAYDANANLKTIFNVEVRSRYYECSSKHHDNQSIFWEDGEQAMCYIDSVGYLSNYQQNTHKYHENGKTGGSGYFDYDGTFNDLGLTLDIEDAKYGEANAECIDCGCRLYEDDVHWVDGDVYCYDCYSENFRYCHHCNSEVSSENWSDGWDMCLDCKDEHVVTCDICEDELHEDDLYHHPASDSWVCNYCYNHDYEWYTDDSSE